MVQYLPLRLVGRLAGPQRDHLVERLDEHGAAVGVEQLDRLGVGAQDAGAEAEDAAGPQRLSSIAAFVAATTGWVKGRFATAVPSLSLFGGVDEGPR